MERKIYLTVCFIYLAVVVCFSAIPDETFYNAYITNDMPLWKQSLDRLRKQPGQNVADQMRLLDGYYGYIGWCLQENKNDEAEQYLKYAEELAGELEKKETFSSAFFCYKSALAGFRTILTPWKAPFWGLRSINWAKRALSIDKNNPLVQVQFGNIEYYKSSKFGGSKTKALDYFLKAETMIQRCDTLWQENWKYQNLLRIIAQIYAESGDTESAVLYCKKILHKEPRFIWIKTKFYPALLEKQETGK